MKEFLFALDWSMNFYKLHWFVYRRNCLINAKYSPGFSTTQHDSDLKLSDTSVYALRQFIPGKNCLLDAVSVFHLNLAGPTGQSKQTLSGVK
jgi:hypothetical protein